MKGLFFLIMCIMWMVIPYPYLYYIISFSQKLLSLVRMNIQKVWLFFFFTPIFIIAEDENEKKTSISGAYKDYDEMYNGGHLSEEEAKMIGADEESKYSLDHVFVTDFNAIKNDYQNRCGKYAIKNNFLDVTYLDKYSIKQKYFYKLQDLGVEGSPVKLFIPQRHGDIVSSSGYNVFDVYKKNIYEDFIFDTRAPMFDVRTIYNKSSHSLDVDFTFAISINKNFHVGISGSPMFKERLFGTVLQKNENEGNSKQTDMNVRHLPFSAYLFFKSDNNKHFAYLKCSIQHSTILENGGLQNAFEGINYNKLVDGNFLNNIHRQDKITTQENIYKVLAYYQYKFKNFTGYLEYDFEWQRHILNFNIDEELKKQADSTTKIVKRIFHPQSKTINYCAKNADINLNAIYPFITVDSFLKHSGEVGVKNAILNKKLFYKTYLKINFPIRNLDSYRYPEDPNNKENSQKEEQLFVYLEPVLGVNFRFYDVDITLETLLLQHNFDGNKSKKLFCCNIQNREFIIPYFNFDVKYKKKFINIDLNISRNQNQEIINKYETFYKDIRSYEKTNHKDPLNVKDPLSIFLKINGDVTIAKRIVLQPYFIGLLKVGGSYFKQIKHNIKDENDDGREIELRNDINNCCCEPEGNYYNVLHIYGGLFTKINIAGPIFCDIDVSLNKKLRTSAQTNNLIMKCFTLNYSNDNIDNCERLNNIPLFNVYGRLYFSKDFARGVSNLTFGFEGYWNTPFFADKYDFITQQFFCQDKDDGELIKQYPILNVFINFRFGRFEFSAKIINLLQMFTNIVQYNFVSTIYYPTERANYMFTIRYIFID